MGSVKTEELLERIAEALESISSNIDSMEQSLDLMSSVLSDSQVQNGIGSAIAITGMIQTSDF